MMHRKEILSRQQQITAVTGNWCWQPREAAISMSCVTCGFAKEGRVGQGGANWEFGTSTRNCYTQKRKNNSVL